MKNQKSTYLSEENPSSKISEATLKAFCRRENCMRNFHRHLTGWDFIEEGKAVQFLSRRNVPLLKVETEKLLDFQKHF
jgi:hypothetical protein